MCCGTPRETFTEVTGAFNDKFTITPVPVFLAPSVLERVVISIPFFIWQFYTVSETQVEIKIVQTLPINLLTFIDPT